MFTYITLTAVIWFLSDFPADPACISSTNGSVDWLHRNFGPFSVFVPLKHLLALNPDFAPVRLNDIKLFHVIRCQGTLATGCQVCFNIMYTQCSDFQQWHFAWLNKYRLETSMSHLLSSAGSSGCSLSEADGWAHCAPTNWTSTERFNHQHSVWPLAGVTKGQEPQGVPALPHHVFKGGNAFNSLFHSYPATQLVCILYLVYCLTFFIWCLFSLIKYTVVLTQMFKKEI